MAGSRWSSDKVSNNNPTWGFEDQILYPFEGRKYNLMPKSQSMLLSCCVTLYTVGTRNFASVHAHRYLTFGNIEHFGICVTPGCFQVSRSGCCAICLSMDVWWIRYAVSLCPVSEIRIFTWKRGKGKSQVSIFFWEVMIYNIWIKCKLAYKMLTTLWSEMQGIPSPADSLVVKVASQVHCCELSLCLG